MLESIDIMNLALIEDIHIDFEEGFNVLTGETGAGKSIILGALGLLMGDKADSSLVRTGADEAGVHAVVAMEEHNPLLAMLEEKGIFPEDGTLLIRRVVKRNGRGTIHIQSIPVTRSDLATISDVLFDMHGQHEHQSLLSSDRQRRVLDNYAGLEPALVEYGEFYRSLEQMCQEYRTREQVMVQASREVDYLRFVVEEFEKAKVEADEDVRLEEEIRILSQFETIHENLEIVHGNLGEGAYSSLSTAVQAMRRASKADGSLVELSSRLEGVLLEARDIAETIRDRLSNMSFSQERLDGLQSRLAQLQRLKKKYGPSLDEVIAFASDAARRLAEGEEGDEYLSELAKKIEQQDMKVQNAAMALRRKRIEVAQTLQKQISSRLAHLGMPHVVFAIEVSERERSVHGADQIDFLFSANLGEPMRSLKEIASGGELSRVMLAVKTVLAEADDVETLVFDEVDAGIGGAVAIAVGEQMAKLAGARQVIAITHLASIASKANNHLVVHKDTLDGRTYTHIRRVGGEDRIREIARMLSGHGEDKKALDHARSLMGE